MESALYQPLPDGLTVIETLRYDPALGPVRGLRHLNRMQGTAQLLGLPFDKLEAAAHLDAVTSEAPQRVRLTLTEQGMHLETAPLPPTSQHWTVAVSDQRLRGGDPWLQVKTSQRALYDTERARLPKGLDEWLFLNEAGHLAEGTITNIFLRRKEVFLTPPLQDGCLPGVLRAELLDTGRAREATLTPKDLTEGDLFVGNSLRGLIPAKLKQG